MISSYGGGGERGRRPTAEELLAGQEVVVGTGRFARSWKSSGA